MPCMCPHARANRRCRTSFNVSGGKDWQRQISARSQAPNGVDGECAPSRWFITPNYGGKQDYRVKVTDKAGKIQFVYANGGTTTLTRLDPRVSIKSYDAQGNEVYANSTNLAYEK